MARIPFPVALIPFLLLVASSFASSGGSGESPRSLSSADVHTAQPVSWGQIRSDLEPHRPVTIIPASGASGSVGISFTGTVSEPLDIGTDAGDISPEFADAVAFEDLHWDYGGFHPATNCVRSAVEISGLNMARDGLGFSYVQDLSSWGLDHGDAGALACLFVLNDENRWVGGKFDWISSSRNKRDFKNVYSGYAGWSLFDVPNPCLAAFLIVSADGRHRSNVISSIWTR